MESNSSDLCLSSVPKFQTEQTNVWLIIFLACLTAQYAFSLSGLMQQYKISKDVDSCKKEYESFELH